MNFENTLRFAQALGQADLLSELRQDFLFPQQNGDNFIYLCCSSLGVQLKATPKIIEERLKKMMAPLVYYWRSVKRY
jgi:kynureninase